MGSMNAYVAGAGKLAGALAADGSAPAALAQPRRAILLFALLGGALLVPLAAGVLDVDALIRACSASFVAVYVLATAAGTRLLAGRARRSAAIAFVAVSVVFAFSGAFLLVPAVVAVAVLARGTMLSPRTSPACPEPG
jgi:amino acid efflux transporter